MSLFDVAAAADIRPRSSCSIEQLPVISAAATVSCSSLYTRPKSAAVSPHSRAAVGCVVSCYCDQLWKVAVWRAGQMSATISTSCSRKLCDYPADLPSTGIPAKLFVLKNCKSSPPLCPRHSWQELLSLSVGGMAFSLCCFCCWQRGGMNKSCSISDPAVFHTPLFSILFCQL